MIETPSSISSRSGASFLKVVLGVVVGGCLLLVLIVLVVLGIIGGAARKARDHAAAEAQRLEALPLSSVTWEEVEQIVGPESKSTGLQKDTAWESFRGKKVRWTGTVLAVNELLGTRTLQAAMNPDAKLRPLLISDVLVALAPAEEEKAKALALTPRAGVTFEGVLDRQNLKIGHRFALVTLRHGKIVE